MVVDFFLVIPRMTEGLSSVEGEVADCLRGDSDRECTEMLDEDVKAEGRLLAVFLAETSGSSWITACHSRVSSSSVHISGKQWPPSLPPITANNQSAFVIARLFETNLS